MFENSKLTESQVVLLHKMYHTVFKENEKEFILNCFKFEYVSEKQKKVLSQIFSRYQTYINA